MEKPFFNKQMSSYIKGIMLILMYILHFFCFPDWYVGGVELANIRFMEGMQGHFQICIAGFSFLTGYFYAYTKHKTLRYSLKKIVEILIPYWFVYVLFLALAIITRTANLEARSIIMEVLTVELHVMYFCWYVSFYILSMLSLPLLKKICHNNRIAFTAVGILGPIALYYLITHFISIHWVTALLEKYQVYFPIMVIGYATAEFRAFERIESIFSCSNTAKAIKAVISLVLVFAVFTEPGWLYRLPMDGLLLSMFRKLIRIVSIPLFIFGLIVFLNIAKKYQILKPLEMIGQCSLLMWFIHSIFFGCSKEIFQPLLFLPKLPFLVLLWGLLINWIVARCLRVPIDRIKTILMQRFEVN